MREPSDRAKALISDADRLRGRIIGAYSQVEHLITDIVLRARRLECYAHLPEGLPYRLKTRIERVEALFEQEGPLKRYAPRAKPLLNGLTRYEGIRVMMAHGLFILDMKRAPPTFEYRMFRAEKASEISEGLMVTDADQLALAASEISAYAQAVVSLFQHIYLTERLESL